MMGMCAALGLIVGLTQHLDTVTNELQYTNFHSTILALESSAGSLAGYDAVLPPGKQFGLWVYESPAYMTTLMQCWHLVKSYTNCIQNSTVFF